MKKFNLASPLKMWGMGVKGISFEILYANTNFWNSINTVSRALCNSKTHQSDTVPWSGGEVPNTILSAGVIVRVVGGLDLAERSRHFELAPSFLAVPAIVV